MDWIWSKINVSQSLFFLIFQKYLFMSLLFFHLFLFSVSSVFPALCSPSFVFFLISDDNCRSQSYRWVNMTMWLSDQILNTLILLMMKSFFSFIFIWATVQKIIPITCLLQNHLLGFQWSFSLLQGTRGVIKLSLNEYRNHQNSKLSNYVFLNMVTDVFKRRILKSIF